MGSHRRGGKRSKHVSNQTGGKSDNPADPITVSPQGDPQLSQSNAQPQEHKQPWDHEATIARWTIVVGFFTFVLAVATGYSAYVLNATDHTLKDTLKSQTASSERQLRAYVNATRSQLDMFGSTEQIKISVEVKNTGQTPAYKLRYRMEIFSGPFPLKEDLTIEAGESSSVLGPGGDVLMGPLQMANKLTPEQVNEIIAGRMAVYAQGIIKYADAFGKDRTTKFNLFYRGTGKPPAFGDIPINLSHAKTGNEAD